MSFFSPSSSQRIVGGCFFFNLDGFFSVASSPSSPHRIPSGGPASPSCENRMRGEKKVKKKRRRGSESPKRRGKAKKAVDSVPAKFGSVSPPPFFFQRSHSLFSSHSEGESERRRASERILLKARFHHGRQEAHQACRRAQADALAGLRQAEQGSKGRARCVDGEFFLF